MTGRANLIANTLTDVSTSVVEQGGAVTVAVLEKGGGAVTKGLTGLDNCAELFVIASNGWVKDARALEEIKDDERAFNRLERAEALKARKAAYDAAQEAAGKS